MLFIKKALRIFIEYVASVIFIMCFIMLVMYLKTGHITALADYSIMILVTAVICAVLLVLMGLLIKYLGERRYLNSPLSKIDKMSGEEFETYLKIYFESKGYKVERTPLSNDYGADLVCKDKYETVVVQAKRYEASVGNSAVQEVVAAKEYYEADRCIVITNSYFTKNAYALAEANNVELWDRDDLVRITF